MKRCFFILSFLITLVVQSQDIHKHQLWDGLLQAFVNEDGLVNYAAFKKKRLSLTGIFHNSTSNINQHNLQKPKKKLTL